MLENRKFNIIISLAIAIGLWMYVVGEVNPISETHIKDIPIVCTNMEVLAERGLAVSSISADRIEVDVKGSRADLAGINTGDIKVSADVGAADRGENEIAVEVRVPDGLEVTKKSMNKIIITVEPLKKKTVPVVIDYKGILEKNQEAVTVRKSHDTATVIGAETLVDSVKRVKGTIDATSIGAGEKQTECVLTPIDKNGKEVSRIRTLPQRVNVTSTISGLKEVKLNVPLKDNSDDDRKRTIEYPETLTIKGSPGALKEISVITAEPVDVTGKVDGDSIKIKIILPEGVEISDKNLELSAVVRVEEMEEKSFVFAPEEIKITGGEKGHKYGFGEEFSVNVVIKGRKKDIDKLEKTDISIFAKVTETTEQNATAEISAKCSKKHSVIFINPQTADLSVKVEEIKEEE